MSKTDNADDAFARTGTAAARRMAQTYRDLVEFASLRCDAVSAADIERNVAWLLPACERAGLRARRIENGDRPMVFAEMPRHRTDAKTVLFYLHFDGQPANASGWDQDDPWQPALKRRAGEDWETLDLALLYGERVDPEWRLFGRAVADDKGPIVMLLAALSALGEAGVEPAVNVKIILDSEEEKGSPSRAACRRRTRHHRRADARERTTDDRIRQPGRANRNVDGLRSAARRT